MSEISFLLDLLLNEKLSKSVKQKITDRVKEIEAAWAKLPLMAPPPRPIVGAQSPSTIAALERQAAEGLLPPVPMPEVPAAPGVVAVTPQTVAAVNSRTQAINQALSGKAEPGRTSPRKF